MCERQRGSLKLTARDQKRALLHSLHRKALGFSEGEQQPWQLSEALRQPSDQSHPLRLQLSQDLQHSPLHDAQINGEATPLRLRVQELSA